MKEGIPKSENQPAQVESRTHTNIRKFTEHFLLRNHILFAPSVDCPFSVKMNCLFIWSEIIITAIFALKILTRANAMNAVIKSTAHVQEILLKYLMSGVSALKFIFGNITFCVMIRFALLLVLSCLKPTWAYELIVCILMGVA